MTDAHPGPAVQTTFDRIKSDHRHRALIVLHDKAFDDCTFGNWSMALADDSDTRIAGALRKADPVIRGPFESFISARKNAVPTSLVGAVRSN